MGCSGPSNKHSSSKCLGKAGSPTHSSQTGNPSKASASYKRWNLSTSYQPGILFPINISGKKLIWSNWVKSSQRYIYCKIELVFEPEYVVTHWGSCLYTAVANTRHKSYEDQFVKYGYIFKVQFVKYIFKVQFVKYEHIFKGCDV